MLYTLEMIRSDFDGFEPIEWIQGEVELSEGSSHVGVGNVVRFIGRKVS
jgi:hypothetical protein